MEMALGSHLAVYDGSSWSGNSLVVNNIVRALLVSDTTLYVGGDFTSVGSGISANRVAKWDGTSWSAIGSGVNGNVYALGFITTYVWDPDLDNYVPRQDLCVGGEFTTAGGNNASRIVKWDGSSWTAIGSGTGGNFPRVRALTTQYDSYLFIGGDFTTAGGTSALRTAKWDGNNWASLQDGFNGQPFAAVVIGSDLYVGGDFTVAPGELSANYIAKWNGSTWSTLGSGMDAAVTSLAVNGNNLYAGGIFATAGGITTNGIAQWNGSSWSALGNGVGGDVPYVRALAVVGNDLYVGGDFTMAGGSSASRIAKWNGSTWSALGTGLNAGVFALTNIGNDIYAGGDFTTAGGNAAIGIAKWNSTSWSALGSGLGTTGSVSALAVIGNNLYAGGYFLSPGYNIAKWDGSSWSSIRSDTIAQVYSLAAHGNDLYASVKFWNASDNQIAKWDGTGWSTLGSGLDAGQGGVTAITASGIDLFIGGGFTKLGGGKTSQYVGRWSKPIAAAATTKTFTTPQGDFLSFNTAGNTAALSIKITSSNGGPTVTVFRYEDSPQNVTGIVNNVSPYRWIIQQIGIAPSFTSEIRFKISEIPSNNISDPNSIIIYSRPTPGNGTFAPLTTSYDGVNDELVVSGISNFGEFAFSSVDPLPTELVSFTATVNHLNIELKWTTAMEVGNYGFEVQRSEVTGQRSEVGNQESGNGGIGEWARAAFIEGSGNSNSPKEYAFVDKNLKAGKYSYRLKQVDNDGKFKYSQEVEVNVGSVPKVFVLEQNYPNPFNPTTTISFMLQASGYTSLKVYDILGREVAALVNEYREAGSHTLHFNASQLASGFYLMTLRNGNNFQVKKIQVLR